MPGHLNGFQLALIRLLGIIFELRQLGHQAMQISEADRERIGVGMFLAEKNSDVFGVVPGQVFWHVNSVLRFRVLMFQGF